MNYKEIVNKFAHLMDHAENMDLVLEHLGSAIDAGLTYPILEIGNNMGGSALCFLEVLKQKGATNWLYTVDPYGSIKYHNGAFSVDKSFYTNERYRLAAKEIANYCFDNNMNHYHFRCTSEDYMQKFAPIFTNYDDAVPSTLDKFSFVFLDGSHDPEVVKKECEYFFDRIAIGGVIVVDDVEQVVSQLSGMLNGRPFRDQSHNQRFVARRKKDLFDDDT
jgi:predicted O-methyltransferase YrrM